MIVAVPSMPPSPPSDSPQDLEALARRAREGDREAYDALFATAAERLALYLRLRFPAAEEEDLLQDVYLRAHERFDAFEDRGRGSVLAWLCSIANARGVDELRRRGVRESGGPSVARALELAHDPRTGPFTAAGRVEARAAVTAAIAALPDEQRECLLDHVFEGLSQAEIAERRGMSSSAVQRHVASALVAVGRPLRSLAGGAT